ncbi:MAG: hypothetical protein A2Y14_03120 [Verrucomicrobia bacterium GWF2_51_19]|nr:MAG: hypothetical protein A2Y14_03120 [Verrucomicrobia bacterium GWF2_51_19]HCJ11595.1 hypothetical protein [Opitutae bacterium]
MSSKAKSVQAKEVNTSPSPFLHRKRKDVLGVNIVPLVDVLITLLFFFMMSFSFRNMRSLNVQLPQMETAGTSNAQRVTVTIDKSGGYFYNGKSMPAEQLLESLQLLGTLNPNQDLTVAADRDTKLSNVTFVMDSARKSKVENIHLQTL